MVSAWCLRKPATTTRTQRIAEGAGLPPGLPGGAEQSRSAISQPSSRRRSHPHVSESACKLHRDSTKSYLNLAKIYALAGNQSDARGVLQQLLAQHADDEQAKKLLEQLPQ